MFHPQYDQIQIATLNVRRLSTRERLTELQEALRRTYVDILAVMELRWRGVGCMDLVDSEDRFFYAGPEDAKAPSGTGFLVSKRIIPFVDTFQRETDRASRLDLRFGQHIIRCMSIYAPPSSHLGSEDEESYSKFLEELQILLAEPRSQKLCSNRGRCSNDMSQVHPLLLGDFNAKIGRKADGTESCVGMYGYGDGRNIRGQLVVDFCEELHLRVAATFFKTRSGRKWTWKSPDGNTLNCIDHILACPHLRFNCVRTGSLQFESDHRLLRGVLQWPKNSAKTRRKPHVRHYLDRAIYENAISNACPKTLDCSLSGYEELCKYISNAAEPATLPLESRSCLSKETLALMKQRHQLKKTISSPLDRLAFTETCKMLRRRIRDDIRLHHCQIVQKAVQSRQSLKKIRSGMEVGEMTVPIKICRGVRQGDTISPKLFTATLEHVFRKLAWDDYGLSVSGNQLNNLRFADDVVLIAKSTEELQAMVNDLDKHSLHYVLNISTAKTKIMASDGTTITLRGIHLERVESFVYLGQKISLDRDHTLEIERRIRAGWSCLRRYKEFFLSRTVEMKWKRELFNMCILPAMLYGAETWVLTKAAERKLASAQRAMERRMIGIRLLDKRTNAWIRGVTKIKDAVNTAKERKWAYGWELAMSNNIKWSRELMEWRPPLTRPAGRPKARWRDDFQKVFGTCNWQNFARMMTKKEWIDVLRCRIL
ncbi:hypothetical protein Y032_0007g3453 [Ancylostoma ceylanicum]|uniref:Uncharacterized protein n=1 Tax=Ancylostoma ceylanicum TaxID=53326 RepID=A0A016VP58_9BILA|nr:hypothetical protein Y032_0007g3453 [Ancylostoma ceylanicum]